MLRGIERKVCIRWKVPDIAVILVNVINVVVVVVVVVVAPGVIDAQKAAPLRRWFRWRGRDRRLKRGERWERQKEFDDCDRIVP